MSIAGRELADATARGMWWGGLALVLYHAVFVVLVVSCSPVLLWRLATDRRYRTGLRDRTGRVAPTSAGRRCVWVHGVSVGEVKGAGQLIAKLRAEHPELEVVVSTTTSTGQEVARRLYPDARVIYYPIDFGFFPGRALDRIRPCCVLLMELEIWPNFLQAAARRGVPVAVINGRISHRSFRGYRVVRPWLPQLGFIGLYCVQTDTYAERLVALNIPAERIVVTGNMKYDGVMVLRVPDESAALRAWLAPDGRRVLVCGSTHGREDEWVAEVAGGLATERPVRIVTVPRHPERADVVVDALAECGFGTVRWGDCEGGVLPRLADRDVVVVDRIGRLESFYGACDIAFVGGSLVPHGGQNMLEPAAMGKPVLFGPHTDNFRSDVQLLLGGGGAVQVETLDDLAREIASLLADSDRCRKIADRAVAVIRANQGATGRTFELLRPLLDEQPGAAG